MSAPPITRAVPVARESSDLPGRGERLLVVADDLDIADLLRSGLRFFGFDVRVARNASEALAVAEEFRPHLLLSDVTLPDVDGFVLCREIRRTFDPIGVVFMTDRDRIEDATVGLSVGGDDYISKPFSLDEVIARVQAVLRRLEPPRRADNDRHAATGDPVLRFADLEMDQDSREVRRGGEFIDLSPTEFALLRYLLLNGGRVVSRKQILSHVWSYSSSVETTIVDTYVSYLRKKIDRFDLPLIHTVRGVGITLRAAR